MAILLLQDGTIETDLSAISNELEPLGVKLRHYDLRTSSLEDMVAKPTFTDEEKRHILRLHEGLFKLLRKENGYLWSDLLNMHPGSANLETWIGTYGQYHTHNAAEGIYLLAGEIMYGFVKPDKSQVETLITSQEYLHIPAGLQHWCSFSASLHFKVIRYFTSVEGCMPIYTSNHQKFTI
jgi:1,2-dihydroxy-3-keto-5-methylthiopentene dioxygenase